MDHTHDTMWADLVQALCGLLHGAHIVHTSVSAAQVLCVCV